MADAGRPVRARQQALSRRASRSTTSASTSRRGRATRSAARTARARARSARSWRASTRPTKAASCSTASRSRFSGPTAALAAGVGDGPPGARVLREPLGRREPLSGALPAPAGFVVAARRWSAAPRRCSAPIDADDRRSPFGRRADDRPAADAADRRRGRPRRARHRLRRADQQPVAARGRAALRPDRTAARARRDLHLRQPPHATRSSGSATPSPCCATAATWPRSRSPTLDRAAVSR